MLRYHWLAALPVLALSLPANGQESPSVATASFDLNRDGQADMVSLDSLGTISVSIAGSNKAGAWTALSTSGAVVGGRVQVSQDAKLGGRTIIVVNARLEGRGSVQQEAVILDWKPGRLESLWRGPVGSVGRDGETSVSLELGRFGVIKYSNRAGVFRCDGETAHLAAQRFDFSSSRFRPARQATRVSTTAQTLTAQSQAPEGISPEARGIWFRARGASSSLRAPTVADLVAPLEVTDGDEQTAWVENKSGTGRGEFITLSSKIGDVPVKALRLRLGHGAAPEDFNRPKRMALLVGKSQEYWIDVLRDPAGQAQWVVLPEPVTARCLTLILDDVYPRAASRSNSGRTAISELSVLSVDELSPGGSAKFFAQRVGEGKVGADLGLMLGILGDTAGPALLEQLGKEKTKKSKTRLRLALARIPFAPKELTQGLVSPDLRAKNYELLATGLRRLGDASMTALTDALAGKHRPQVTARLAEALARIGSTEALEALVKGLGQGNALRRRALVRALARPPQWTALLAERVPAADDELTKADLCSALGASATGHPVGSEARLAAEASLHTALDSSTNYELSYRVVQALGMVGGASAAEALQRKFTSAIDGSASSIAMRRIILAALGATGEASIQASLVAAVGDVDPGLRLVAIAQLADSDVATPALTQGLNQDEWPEVRRAAAAALGGRCTTDSLAPLTKAARTDPDVQVARTAFSAVIACPNTPGFALALELVDDSKRPLALRLHAGRSLGRLNDGTRSAIILKRFTLMRRQALAKDSSAKLAAAMTTSLTALASPEAIALLESTARDPAFPELQAAAVAGLGVLCPVSSRKLLQRLKREGQQGVNIAARQALARCTRK